jgi:restriction system protein
MAVPEFAAYLLPTLQAVALKSFSKTKEVIEQNARHLALDESALAQMLPSNTMRTHDNRTYWALVYLAKARLLERQSRGVYSITEKGRELLSQNPTSITPKLLRQYADFVMFSGKAQDGETRSQLLGSDSDVNEFVSTPEEQAATSFKRLRDQLCDDVLLRLKASEPRFFEEVVVKLLVAMGYGGSLVDAGRAIGQSGDGGIDGIINEDKLGLDVVYIQAKRWEGTVGRPDIQKFAGALQGKRAKKGVFITTSDFSKEAKEFVQAIESKIVLINGTQLVDYMWEHNVGVATASIYVVKKIDSDFFED